MPNAEDELVLLIHGTFAAPEKGKLKWWEIGSKAWKEIEKRLPAGTRLAKRKEIFHWSGENQERDRCQAGNDLLDRLLKLEMQGRPYHLIGHSHGGSVIWNALQEAVRRRIGCKKRSDPRLELPHLRSWATVGTPFLQFSETRMGRWPGAILTKLFFIISLCLTVALGLALYRYLRGFTAEWASGELAILVIAGVVVSAFIFAAIPGTALYFWTLAIRREALAVRQTAMVRNHAMMEFGSRWFGIWSREDEAISGLKSTVKLRMQLLPRLQFQANQVFQYDRWIWHYRFLLRWLLAPVLNTTFVPYGNSMILSTVSKSAQGDDRPGCTITSVSEGPICFQELYRYPSLPANVDEALVAAANKNLIAKAPDFVPKVRTLLADYSSGVALLGGTIKDSSFDFVGDELVHTSYFDNGNVLDLLTHHVQLHQQDGPAANPSNDALIQWYQSTRRDVAQNVTNDPSVRKRSLVHLAKKNWPAILSVFFGLIGLICLALMVYVLLESDEAALLALGVSVLAALLGIILGRFGQLAAERGARFRRTATIGINLGLLWSTAVVFLPLLAVISFSASVLLDNRGVVTLPNEYQEKQEVDEVIKAFGRGKQEVDEAIFAFERGKQVDFCFVSDRKIFVSFATGPGTRFEEGWEEEWEDLEIAPSDEWLENNPEWVENNPSTSIVNTGPSQVIQFDQITGFSIELNPQKEFWDVLQSFFIETDPSQGSIDLWLKEDFPSVSIPLPRDDQMAIRFIQAINEGMNEVGIDEVGTFEFESGQ